ncbi:MAG: hypothetical protein QF619_07435, partial [Candidatus Binatia bacterium]|nr:hypothetical protein [Candidatus Binatia bacterium]
MLIMPIAGFFGVETVAWGKKTRPAYILLAGVLGRILGQFVTCPGKTGPGPMLGYGLWRKGADHAT